VSLLVSTSYAKRQVLVYKRRSLEVAAARTVLVRRRMRSARPWCYLAEVIDNRLFEELRQRIDQALKDSPAQDVEKNIRALLAAWFERMDLVLREDFEVQKKLLERAQAKLAELEARIAELEARK
jgi:ubiquinone biosynthesis accessory factor UbiK